MTISVKQGDFAKLINWFWRPSQKENSENNKPWTLFNNVQKEVHLNMYIKYSEKLGLYRSISYSIESIISKMMLVQSGDGKAVVNILN